MSFIKKITRKNKDGTTKEYYAEVESVRIGNKVRHRYIRSLGSNPNKPGNFPLERMQFSYLALRLMQGELTPKDVFDMLENMGHPFTRDTLEKMGIRYDFEKKTFSIYLFYHKKSKISLQKDVRSVRKKSTLKKQSKER
ncbi:MAG: hypothetical protein KKA79_07020 [Nanoarchaeota archaeon]|nr:hypothetical protein [Nanoarchaeota archaeon]